MWKRDPFGRWGWWAMEDDGRFVFALTALVYWIGLNLIFYLFVFVFRCI